MKPECPSPFDIRHEIIHEHAFRRLRIGDVMAMPEKLRGRLAGADFVRQDQGIEMAQHVGELHCETLGMNCVRIASEQDAMVPRQLRDQVAHFGVRAKDIAERLGQEFDIAAQLPELMRLLQERQRRQMTALKPVLEFSIVRGRDHRLRGERRKWPKLLQAAPVIDEPDDIAEIENNGFHRSLTDIPIDNVRSNCPHHNPNLPCRTIASGQAVQAGQANGIHPSVLTLIRMPIPVKNGSITIN
jgi:hypothetical protein